MFTSSPIETLPSLMYSSSQTILFPLNVYLSTALESCPCLNCLHHTEISQSRIGEPQCKVLADTVHDTENLTFPQTTARKIRINLCGQSADSARTLRGFHTDNQRIPCGTISKFYSCNDISNDPCGVSRSFSVVAHEVRLLVSTIFTEDPRPPARKICVRPRGSSAAPVRKIRVVPHGTTTEFLRKS